MATQSDERGYRNAEKKFAKQKAKQKFDDALMKSKDELIAVLGHAESLSLKKFGKLHTIISKIERLQNEN